MLSTSFKHRLVALLALLTTLFAAGAWAQPERQPVEGNPVRTPFSVDVQPEWLQQVMPQATSFSDKEGTPPVYSAYAPNDSGADELVGYVFLSADVPPEERGYSAPIDMLIGVDTDFQITGIKILRYVESYVNTLGDFIADPEFQAQFRNKSIRDDFRLQRDIDGISGATVSSFAITRGARDAARRVAEAYLGFQAGDPVETARTERVIELMSEKTWEEYLEDGVLQQLVMPIPGGLELELTLTYMGRPALGEFWIGPTAYARAERDSSARLGGTEMILMAVGGTGYQQFRQDRLSMRQEGMPFRRVLPNRLVPAGNADDGMLAGRAEFAAAIVLDDSYDLSEPITFSYLPLGSRDPYEVDYQVSGLGLRLIEGDPILSEREIARIIRAENSAILKFINDPPWGVTPWGKVLMLTLVFALVMIAFFTKSERWRWAALGLTLVYLGFIDGGFLSVSHITGALKQGPGIFLNNLPVLMIVVFTVVTVLLWGRIFCSSLCPFGALQDMITRFTPKNWRIKVPQVIHDRAIYIKYGILAFIVGAALIANNVSLFQYFEPFGTIFFLSGSAVLFAILAAFLAASVVIPRFYCRYACPLGAALGLASIVSPFRIKRVPQCTVCTVCEHACPTGAIRREKIDFKECVRCDICDVKLITKAGSCRHDMDRIAARHKDLKARPVTIRPAS